VRQPGWAGGNRIRRGRHKKLRRAFRDRLTGAAGAAEWLASLAEEFPGEIETPASAEEVSAEPWFDLYFRAFEEIRFDRHYGAFGGETPISYLAVSRYADDHGVGPDDIYLFRTFLAALDAEWLEHVAHEQKKKER
jgi:hypothetical protein